MNGMSHLLWNMSSVTWNDPPTGQTITTLKLTMAAVCESHVPKECCKTIPMGNVKASKWRLVQKRKRLLRAHHLTFIIVLKAFGANIQRERCILRIFQKVIFLLCTFCEQRNVFQVYGRKLRYLYVRSNSQWPVDSMHTGYRKYMSDRSFYGYRNLKISMKFFHSPTNP